MLYLGQFLAVLLRNGLVSSEQHQLGRQRHSPIDLWRALEAKQTQDLGSPP